MSMSNYTQARIRRGIMLAGAAIAALAIARTVGAQQSGGAQPPAGSAAGAAATAQAATPAAQMGRASWTSDRRNFAVGDIVTVLIDDYTISTAVKDNLASDNRNRNLGVTIRLPEQGSKGAGIDSRNDASQQQRGQQRRENRFQSEMSARVVAVGNNGLLQIRGTKVVDVDKSKQDIVFTGWIRAQDVSPQNMIESYRVADAELGYASPGSLGKPKQGILTKIIGSIWP
jgi:flagellar L-ring protein precursor FlgH